MLGNSHAYLKRNAIYKWNIFQKFVSKVGSLELIINFPVETVFQ